MTYPVPVATSGYDVTFHLFWGTYRWKESFWWSRAEITGFTQVIPDGQTLAGARKVCLRQDAFLDYTTISPYNVPGIGPAESRMGDFSGPGTGIPGAAGVPPTPWDSWVEHVADISWLYKRRINFTAMPTGWWSFDSVSGSSLTPAGQTGMNLFNTVLAGKKVGRMPAALGAWCIKGRDHNPTDNQETPIVGATVNPTLCGTDLATTVMHTWPVGTPVHVHGVSACKPTGLNGDTVVVSSNGLTVTIGKTPCNCCTIPTQSNAFLSEIIEAFYALANFPDGYLYSRKRGIKGGAPRARKRSRCRTG